MIRSRRRWHLALWLLIGPAALGTAIVALALRAPEPLAPPAHTPGLEVR